MAWKQTISSGSGESTVGSDGAPRLIAYPFGSGGGIRVEPASRWRGRMDDTVGRNANRCLPLLMANEAGWVLLNPFPFTAIWDGRDHGEGLAFEFPDGAPPRKFVDSGFGHGILTWIVPFLFRTSPGYNLLARGPANAPKDGVSPLEGVVETDWAVATFTMNWKITRPHHPVTFYAGEPFCMIVPQRRGELEPVEPGFRRFKADPATAEATKQWRDRRHSLRVSKFLSEYSEQFGDYRDAWEQDYFRGRYPDGRPAPEHQTKLRLKKFSGNER